MARESFVNKKFGRLSVIKELYTDHNRSRIMLCKCDCLNTKKVRLQNLKSGTTSSCGCYRDERIGVSKYVEPKLLNTWTGMFQRCYNKNHKDYATYGAVGIDICDEWLSKPDGTNNFMSWALSNGWFEGCGLQIDRARNQEGYNPSNCRFVTPKKNTWNRSEKRSRTVIYRGVEYKFRELCDRFSNLNPKTVYDRYFLRGWSMEDSLTLPSNSALPYNNRNKGTKQMARQAHPHKEKITDLKSEIKDLTRTIKEAAKTAKAAEKTTTSTEAKIEKLQAKLDKLSGTDSPAEKKTAKTAKVSKTSSKSAKAEKPAKKTKKDKDDGVKVKAKRGRPSKKPIDDEDDD